jgi:hypothetical protein
MGQLNLIPASTTCDAALSAAIPIPPVIKAAMIANILRLRTSKNQIT